MRSTHRRFIPTRQDRLITREQLGYLGLDTNSANDVVEPNELIYATDTRQPIQGKQKTRQGCDVYSIPAGEAVDAQQTSTTGASNKAVGTVIWKAKRWTALASGRLTKVEVRLANLLSLGTGPVIVEVYSDNSGSLGTLLAQSSIPAASVPSSYADLAARFIEAPAIVSGTDYWTVAHIQDDGSGAYIWSSTTSATTALTSSDSGTTWSATTYDLRHKAYVSTDSPTLGYYRVVKSDGTRVSFIAYKEAAGTTAVAMINDLTGALTNIKTGLSSSATRYEFEMFNDVVYYVNGVDAPRKYDFTTDDAMGGSPPVSYSIFAHANRLWFAPISDKTKLVFSNLTAPETFTSTDFVYIPSPKSPDHIVKTFVLNRDLYILTYKTKWKLSGTDISVMVLGRSTGTKGCVSAHSVVVDGNYAYFASDDGDYQFNGGTDILLSEDITPDYLSAVNKDEMAGVVWNNRRYLFYTPSGQAFNSRCWVFNFILRKYESDDTGTYIGQGAIWNGPGDDGRMVQSSNLVAAVYYAELSSNTYNNLGRKLSWALRPRYEYFTSPAATHQVRVWRPRFLSQTGTHSVDCTYDGDFANFPSTVSDGTVSMSAGGIRADGSHLVGDGSVVGGLGIIKPQLSIPGERNYTQPRYSREGVNNPVEFHGQTLQAAIKDIR